jgi:dihydroorotase
MADQTLIIRQGRVIDPSQGLDEIADVTIRDGKIADIGKAKSSNGDQIDAAGKIVCPGLVDMHVHLREPGSEDTETIASGCAAAVAGGFTSIVCMPNTQPAIDTEAMIEFVYRQAARASLCNVYPIGAITKGRAGKELAEIGQMVRAGAVGFSDDGRGVASSAVMLRAMQYVAMFGKTLIQHCEDPDLTEGGSMNGGLTATRLGLPGIPAVAEEIMLQRDLLLARSTQCRYHMAHVSTAGAVDLVREARKKGLVVTAEVCPHHLLLTEESVSESEYDTNYKVQPPLRTRKDVEACIAGVVDGTIACLATDHAPHSREEKELDFQNAPFGINSLEIALGLFVKALIGPGRLDWPALIARMTTGPATTLGLKKGTLATGCDADVTVIDPEMNWTVDVATFRSRSRNCPYGGWALKGRATHTIVGGTIRHVLAPEAARTAR